MIKAVMTNPYALMHEGEKINRLFESGMDLLHIRKPKLGKDDIRNLLEQIDPQYLDRVILHNRFALAGEYKVRGVHLSPSDRDNVWVKNFVVSGLRIKNPNLLLSSSYSKPRSLRSLMDGLTHVLLGPVYGVQPNPQIMFKKSSIEDVRKYIEKSPIPAVAMGGISLEVMPFIRQAGFQGICLQRAVWKTVNPVDSFLECISSFENCEEKALRG